MATIQWAYGSLPAVITAGIAVGGAFEGALIGLTTDATPYGLGTQLTDINEATYEGYARSAAVKWGSVVTQTDGTVECCSDSHEFRPTGSTTECSVMQAILVAKDGTTLLASYVLPAPLSFSSPDDAYQVLFPLLLDSDTRGQSNQVSP